MRSLGLDRQASTSQVQFEIPNYDSKQAYPLGLAAKPGFPGVLAPEG